jgi:hypothetical protein
MQTFHTSYYPALDQTCKSGLIIRQLFIYMMLPQYLTHLQQRDCTESTINTADTGVVSIARPMPI